MSLSLRISISVCLLAALFTFTSSLSADLQVCLNCWDELCDVVIPLSNLETTCPCPCINSTFSPTMTKCSQTDISNEANSACCPRTSHFVSTYVEPQLQLVNTTSYSACEAVYNPAPNQFNVSLFDGLSLFDGVSLDNEYVYFGTPFTCSGCISAVTIYHVFDNEENRNLSVQLWKPSRNTTDNSTVLLLSRDQNITYYHTSEDWNSYYRTVGTSDKELCFSPGDIFGVTIPNSFIGLSIFKEKSTPGSQFYYRSRPSCQSLRNVFFLTNVYVRPLIAVNVTSAATDLSSSIITSSSFTMLPDQSSSIDITIATRTAPLIISSSTASVFHSSNTSPLFMSVMPTSSTPIIAITTTSTSSISANKVVTSHSFYSSHSTDVSGSISSSISSSPQFPPNGGPFNNNLQVLIYTSSSVAVIFAILVLAISISCVLIRQRRRRRKRRPFISTKEIITDTNLSYITTIQQDTVDADELYCTIEPSSADEGKWEEITTDTNLSYITTTATQRDADELYCTIEPSSADGGKNTAMNYKRMLLMELQQ